MIKAVLLDLDDTLLDIQQGQFLQAYFAAADQFFAAEFDQPYISRALIESVRSMQTVTHYTQTNSEIAIASILNSTNWQHATSLESALRQFYQTTYPKLRATTSPMPYAADLIRTLQALDVALVIATNPVYPTDAVHQRLDWAALPTTIKDYALVTTSDSMHFTKPNLEYYAEIIAHVGIEPDEAIMIGNDLQQDILPAKQLGLRTFHVTSLETSPADQHGTLQDLIGCINSGWINTVQPANLTPDMIIPELRGNLGTLFGLLHQVKPNQWLQRPIPDEWSIYQVVQHLAQRESNVQQPRLRQIYEESNPFISVPDPDHPPSTMGEDGLSIAHRFANERQVTIDFLHSLQPDDWHRPARHSIFSNTTLLEMAHFVAQHDRMHITQICQTLGRCD